MPRVADDPLWPKKAKPHETGSPISKSVFATAPPMRKLSGQTRPVFKAAAPATTVPKPKPVKKKTTKRSGDSRSLSTEHIVADYLGLCRDPFSDLQSWLELSRKEPLLNTTSRNTYDRKSILSSTERFLRDTLQELSGRVHAHDNRGQDLSMCLIDHEPLLRNIAICNKYKEVVA